MSSIDCTVALRWSSVYVQSWPVPVLHQALIKELANWRETTQAGRPEFLALCRVQLLLLDLQIQVATGSY